MHLLDPRGKLVAVVFLIVSIFAANTFSGLFFLLAVAASMYLLVRIPAGYLVRGLKPVMVIAVLSLFLHFFFTKGGAVLIRWGPFTIEQDGLILGIFTVMRLGLLVSFTMLITLTTTPLSLAGALEYFLRPLSYLKLPGPEIALILTIALRFIPTLMEESDRIIKAQMARGADFEGGNIFRRARSLIPVIVPLFVSAFRRADDLAVAMESRCYRVGARRTRMHELTFTLRDFLAVAAAALLAAAMLWIALT